MKNLTKKILFVHNGLESFILIDRNLLSESFVVSDCYIPKMRDLNLMRLWKSVSENDCVFCWFASWHSFFPILFARLLKKKSVLVIGGYDLAKISEISYGHQRSGLKKWVSRWTMRLASALMTNSNYSQIEAVKNAGLSAHAIKVIYHGIPNTFDAVSRLKENIALTVGNIDRSNLFRKGLEPFVRTAAYLPEMRFVLIGAWKDDSIDYLRSIAPSNVVFTGRVSDEELLEYYRKASVYVQASLHEGFGMSVAEAMLAGCIPVVTKAGALPEVVGDEGIYVDSAEAISIARAIEITNKSSNEQRDQARQRILNLFTLEKRRQSLEQLVLKTMKRHSETV